MEPSRAAAVRSARTTGSLPPRPGRQAGRARGGPIPTSRSSGTPRGSALVDLGVLRARPVLSNSACQPAASSGGIAPVTGRHSGDREAGSVSRVSPPTAIIATTSAKSTASQTAMAATRVGAARRRAPAAPRRAFSPTSSKMLRGFLSFVVTGCGVCGRGRPASGLSAGLPGAPPCAITKAAVEVTSDRLSFV